MYTNLTKKCERPKLTHYFYNSLFISRRSLQQRTPFAVPIPEDRQRPRIRRAQAAVDHPVEGPGAEKPLPGKGLQLRAHQLPRGRKTLGIIRHGARRAERRQASEQLVGRLEPLVEILERGVARREAVACAVEPLVHELVDQPLHFLPSAVHGPLFSKIQTYCRFICKHSF